MSECEDCADWGICQTCLGEVPRGGCADCHSTGRCHCVVGDGDGDRGAER